MDAKLKSFNLGLQVRGPLKVFEEKTKEFKQQRIGECGAHQAERCRGEYDSSKRSRLKGSMAIVQVCGNEGFRLCR